MLPSQIKDSIILKPNENAIRMLRALYSQKNPDPAQTGDLHSGFLLETNQRLIFLKEKGVLSKNYHPIIAIELEKISGCSITGGFNKKLQINVPKEISALPPCFGSFREIDLPTLKPNKSRKTQEMQLEINDLIRNRLLEIEEEKKKQRIQYILDFSFLKAEMEKGGLVMQTIKCPSCHASIQLPDSGNSLKCQYCGSQILAQDVFDKMKGLIGNL